MFGNEAQTSAEARQSPYQTTFKFTRSTFLFGSAPECKTISPLNMPGFIFHQDSLSVFCEINEKVAKRTFSQCLGDWKINPELDLHQNVMVSTLTHPSSMVSGNLLTNWQTGRQTNADENITSFMSFNTEFHLNEPEGKTPAFLNKPKLDNSH